MTSKQVKLAQQVRMIGFVRERRARFQEKQEMQALSEESNDCICTRECDCENPDPESGAALVSHECPEHNIFWKPHPECKASVHWYQK